MAADKPLSFIDHHLKCGDALVGAKVDDLGTAPEMVLTKPQKRKLEQQQAVQLNIFAYLLSQRLPTVMGRILEITGQESDSYDTIQAKEAADQAVQGLKAPFEAIANLWTSAYFGHKFKLADYGAALDALTQPGQLEQQSVIQQAAVLAVERRFFHWELAFPEVFYDQHGQHLGDRAGFDAAIGNPPYIRQEKLSPFKLFYQFRYEVYHGMADIYIYFFERNLTLLRQQGRLSFIGSNSWLKANYASPLRAYFQTRVQLESLIDLGDTQVFVSALDVYPAIPIIIKKYPPKDYVVPTITFGRQDRVDLDETLLDKKWLPVSIHDQSDDGWRLERQDIRKLVQKLLNTGKTLEKFTKKQMFRGVLTGFNQAFIIDGSIRNQLIQADPKSADQIKPIISGANVRPWYTEQEDQWLICMWQGSNIDEYPAIKEWLKKFRRQLKPRPSNWDQKGRWPGRKSGSYKWYELQDTIAYRDEFEKPKIFYPELSKYPRFSMAEAGIIGNKTAFFIPGEDYYLLGILMSRLIWFVIKGICQPIGERAGMLRYTLSSQFMRDLPIIATDGQPQDTIAILAKQLTSLAHQRYELQQQIRHRILNDLGYTENKLNQKLTAWWELDFANFRTEIKKTLKRDIPLAERDDWETYLSIQQRKHQELTKAIVDDEHKLNEQVYDLYNLNRDEIKLIEEITVYQYGEI